MPDLFACTHARSPQGAGGGRKRGVAEKCGGSAPEPFFSEAHHVVTFFCFCGGFLLVRRLQVFSLERIGWMRCRHILFGIAVSASVACSWLAGFPCVGQLRCDWCLRRVPFLHTRRRILHSPREELYFSYLKIFDILVTVSQHPAGRSASGCCEDIVGLIHSAHHFVFDLSQSL